MPQGSSISPNIYATYPGATIENWQTAESDITTIGSAGVLQKVHSLILDMTALVGTVTIRLYHNVNGVERQSYSQDFTVAADGPGLWIINGTLAITGAVRVTAQSDNALDNGLPIGWEYVRGTA